MCRVCDIPSRLRIDGVCVAIDEVVLFKSGVFSGRLEEESDDFNAFETVGDSGDIGFCVNAAVGIGENVIADKGFAVGISENTERTDFSKLAEFDNRAFSGCHQPVFSIREIDVCDFEDIKSRAEYKESAPVSLRRRFRKRCENYRIGFCSSGDYSASVRDDDVSEIRPPVISIGDMRKEFDDDSGLDCESGSVGYENICRWTIRVVGRRPDGVVFDVIHKNYAVS